MTLDTKSDHQAHGMPDRTGGAQTRNAGAGIHAMTVAEGSDKAMAKRHAARSDNRGGAQPATGTAARPGKLDQPTADASAPWSGAALETAEAKGAVAAQGAALAQAAGTKEGRARIVAALTGKREADLSPAQRKAVDAFFTALTKEGLKGIDTRSAPSVPARAIAEGKVEGDALPEGVLGVAAKGASGKDVVLLAKGQSEAKLDRTALEEVGEVLATRARAAGIDVAKGDAGARLVRAMAKETVLAETDPAAFAARKGDTTTVVIDGKAVEGQARAAPDPDQQKLEPYGINYDSSYLTILKALRYRWRDIVVGDQRYGGLAGNDSTVSLKDLEKIAKGDSNDETLAFNFFTKVPSVNYTPGKDILLAAQLILQRHKSKWQKAGKNNENDDNKSGKMTLDELNTEIDRVEKELKEATREEAERVAERARRDAEKAQREAEKLKEQKDKAGRIPKEGPVPTPPPTPPATAEDLYGDWQRSRTKSLDLLIDLALKKNGTLGDIQRSKTRIDVYNILRNNGIDPTSLTGGGAGKALNPIMKLAVVYAVMAATGNNSSAVTAAGRFLEKVYQEAASHKIFGAVYSQASRNPFTLKSADVYFSRLPFPPKGVSAAERALRDMADSLGDLRYFTDVATPRRPFQAPVTTQTLKEAKARYEAFRKNTGGVNSPEGRIDQGKREAVEAFREIGRNPAALAKRALQLINSQEKGLGANQPRAIAAAAVLEALAQVEGGSAAMADLIGSNPDLVAVGLNQLVKVGRAKPVIEKIQNRVIKAKDADFEELATLFNQIDAVNAQSGPGTVFIAKKANTGLMVDLLVPGRGRSAALRNAAILQYVKPPVSGDILMHINDHTRVVDTLSYISPEVKKAIGRNMTPERVAVLSKTPPSPVNIFDEEDLRSIEEYRENRAAKGGSAAQKENQKKQADRKLIRDFYGVDPSSDDFRRKIKKYAREKGISETQAKQRVLGAVDGLADTLANPLDVRDKVAKAMRNAAIRDKVLDIIKSVKEEVADGGGLSRAERRGLEREFGIEFEKTFKSASGIGGDLQIRIKNSKTFGLPVDSQVMLIIPAATANVAGSGVNFANGFDFKLRVRFSADAAVPDFPLINAETGVNLTTSFTFRPKQSKFVRADSFEVKSYGELSTGFDPFSLAFAVGRGAMNLGGLIGIMTGVITREEAAALANRVPLTGRAVRNAADYARTVAQADYIEGVYGTERYDQIADAIREELVVTGDIPEDLNKAAHEIRKAVIARYRKEGGKLPVSTATGETYGGGVFFKLVWLNPNIVPDGRGNFEEFSTKPWFEPRPDVIGFGLEGYALESFDITSRGGGNKLRAIAIAGLTLYEGLVGISPDGRRYLGKDEIVLEANTDPQPVPSSTPSPRRRRDFPVVPN